MMHVSSLIPAVALLAGAALCGLPAAAQSLQRAQQPAVTTYPGSALSLESFTVTTFPEFPQTAPSEVGRTDAIKQILIVLSPQATELEKRYGELAAKHFRLRDKGLSVSVQSGAPASVAAGTAVIYVSRTGGLSEVDAWLAGTGFAVPTDGLPGPEGFVGGLTTVDSITTAHIVAVDERAVLYGLGWVMLQTRVDSSGLSLPQSVAAFATAPRIAYRTTNGSGRQAMDPRSATQTGARRMTTEDGTLYLEEQLLFGTNQFVHGMGSSVLVNTERYNDQTGAGVSIDRSELSIRYGIDYVIAHSINGIGRDNMKPGWEAHDFGGLHNANVCVSNPEARAFLLEIKENYFKHQPKIDRIIFAASDVAGCYCDACSPWSHTFWDLMQEMTEALHKYHPNAKAIFTNQDFQEADNKWFFERILNERPDWLGGFCMAPGGSESLSYGGIIPNAYWNRYPGLFPLQSFLRSRLRYLAPNYEVIALPDISHWKRAEYGIPYIDPILSEIYHRRTFNARPAAYHHILTSYTAYVDGLFGYTEGSYDDFNKFMLLRLAWDPQLTAYEITREYYAYYAGEAAADLLAQAAMLGEVNYALPVLENEEGIRRVYDLITEARPQIPASLLANDWRYAMLAQRAATDLYIYERQSRLNEAYKTALATLETPAANDPAVVAQLIKALNDVQKESESEAALRKEAIGYDDMTNRAAAIRSSALLVIEDYDGIGVNWLISKLEQVRNQQDKGKRAQLIDAIVNYDRVGPGEFFEMGGTIDRQPHFDFGSGELYYGTGSRPKESRPSERFYNYSHSHQPGLRYNFDGLDTATDYELTFTYANPGGVSFAINSDNEYAVVVNGEEITRQVPTRKGYDRITVPVPARLFQDGKLTLEFLRAGDNSRSTCISEVWLRKAK